MNIGADVMRAIKRQISLARARYKWFKLEHYDDTDTAQFTLNTGMLITEVVDDPLYGCVSRGLAAGAVRWAPNSTAPVPRTYNWLPAPKMHRPPYVVR